MTHQNHQTNGASLEDCHTNFFALTELYGIKWRKLVWGESAGDGEEGGPPLADPVISSYARCLAGDILCVWRRVPSPQYDMTTPAPPLSLRAAKELWIFWYGEEPDLNGLVAPELIASQGEQGSWESGLSYECRSLLFKALHNLIERCLLSRDFVRLGKWFVQPYDGDEEDVGKSPWHLSFSFAFFLHGESTVCASVDVRQHPPVRTLTAKRLARLNQPEHQGDAKVILAPFGLEGTVTGREWSDNDAATSRLLDAWRQLYPLEQGCGAVEVSCGGVRMRYPLPYVLETELPAPRAPPPSAAALAQRTLSALTAPAPHQAAEICYGESLSDKAEDFVDPTRKTPCSCAKAAGGATVCSPGSCGGGSPAQPVSAPSSAGAPPPSPHHQTTAQHQSAATVPTTLHTPAPTPDPHAPPTPAPPPGEPRNKLYQQGDSPPTTAANNSKQQTELLVGAGRPLLPSASRRQEPLEDETELHMLYDYTTVHAWLEHPVKRFKTEDIDFQEELALGAKLGEDLYAGHEHTRMAAVTDHCFDIKQEKHEHQEDVKEYKNLFTSDGLCPTFKDLEQIFDNSDDAASGDEAVRLLQVQTPPDSNKSTDERCGAAGGGRCVRAEELSKMFPTPPSLEAHAQPSPNAFSLPDDSTPAPHRASGSPPPAPIEDWSYVFKPPTMYKYVGSSKYAPLLALPSQLLPPVALPPCAVYRPRWQREPSSPKSASVKRSSSPAPEPRAPSRRACDTAPLSAGAVTSVASNSASVALSPVRGSCLAGGERAPAACPLLLNVLLSDTVLNVYRDHNFDSCTLCVCHAGAKLTVGNIRGADSSTYLSGAWGEEEGAGAHEDEPSHCSCGFSAIVNRRLAHRAGLFYEDEMDITGLAEEPSERSTCALADIADVVLAQCAAPAGGSASALTRAARLATQQHAADHLRLNLLEYSDGGLAAAKALRAAAGGYSGAGRGGARGVHRWPFIGARAPRSSRDVVRLMRRLRPLLQDAIQKRCCGARMWDGVTGPLTWRQFHRLAGRGNEDLCEPQPVPPLLVGHDKDWISLSPYALRHWERLALEPYSYSRDVAYVVLAADSEVLSEPLKIFFRELSTVYEACRLGRHQPITRIAKDGIVRTSPETNRDANTEEWTGDLPPGRCGDYIRSYAEALRTSIVPQLANLPIDRSLFQSERASHLDRPSPSPMRPPTTPDHPPTPSSQSDPEDSTNTSSSNTPGGGGSWEEEEGGQPALVIYIVEPPSLPPLPAPALHALLRLAARAHRHLPHLNPLIKIISLEGVCETWGISGGCESELRALAFSVFGGSRRLLQHHANGKSLTGFGTAANANLFLNSKDEKNRAPYKLFSPLWVLAPPRALKEVAETWGQAAGNNEAGGGILFVSYCLSHDQRWLLCAATDARGELLHTHAVNIHVPARSRRRRSGGGGARNLGLTKLMDWALGVMSQAAQPWRLVVGRVGRIGHGELKGWSWLLSRRNLTRASAVLRDICSSCSVLYPSNVPCILSACLVSTEPDSCLRLMADRFTPDERFSQASIQSHLHTPRDVTATHILVFPTSATTQSNQMPFEPPMTNGVEDIFPDVDMGDEDMGEENMSDLFIGDMFMWPAANSPRRPDDDERDGSPTRNQHHQNNTAEQGSVLQQPLALGYMVSTAPLGAMPGWWWASCAHLKDSCPAFLKNALHLHSGNLQSADDFTSLTQRRDHNTHPLDSTTTTDVLRYVLEGYNALSWLALDGATHDRLSCLPLHVQALIQLYHAAAALG